MAALLAITKLNTQGLDDSTAFRPAAADARLHGVKGENVTTRKIPKIRVFVMQATNRKPQTGGVIMSYQPFYTAASGNMLKFSV